MRCDFRLKEQRDRAESEHQEECDLYMKRNHDLKAEVDRLQLDITDRQVKDKLQLDITDRQVKDRLQLDITDRQVKDRLQLDITDRQVKNRLQLDITDRQVKKIDRKLKNGGNFQFFP